MFICLFVVVVDIVERAAPTLHKHTPKKWLCVKVGVKTGNSSTRSAERGNLPYSEPSAYWYPLRANKSNKTIKLWISLLPLWKRKCWALHSTGGEGMRPEKGFPRVYHHIPIFPSNSNVKFPMWFTQFSFSLFLNLINQVKHSRVGCLLSF